MTALASWTSIGSRTWLRTIRQEPLVQVFLEGFKAGIRGQIWIPLRVELDTLPSRPHDPIMARLSGNCCVAEAARPGAIKLFTQKSLELCLGRIFVQTHVPLRVQIYAIIHGPRHISVTLVSFNHSPAQVARFGATAVATMVQVALELLKTGSTGQASIPLWMLANSMEHRPPDFFVASLPLDGCVAKVAGTLARESSPRAQFGLKLLESRVMSQPIVPLWVLRYAVVFCPEHSRVALLALNCRRALLKQLVRVATSQA